MLLLFLALAPCGSVVAWAQKPACSTGTIQTSSGLVCGTTSSVTITGSKPVTAAAYLGIPYGVPPTGSLRWQYSTPFKSSGMLPATAFGNECPQSIATSRGGVVPPMSQCTDGQVLGSGQSEDCLYLNVWVPDGATASSQLPVMVFIHGGAFVSGTGGAPSDDLYDGTYLAATGKVIVVTFNYRLGVLGFLPHGGKYNFGFADQILALHWVRKNIAGFGGDPHSVTLFGESAGAMSTGLHALSSPKSAGLFQAAIMESNLLGLPYKTTSQAQALRKAFCPSGSSLCTTAATTCDLIAAQTDFTSAQFVTFLTLPDLLMWAPAVDNVYVTRQPMSSAGSLSVPLLLGTNHDEGINFAYLHATRGPIDPAHYAEFLDRLFGSANSQRVQSRERYHCDSSPDCIPQIANVLTDAIFTCPNRQFAIRATRSAKAEPLSLYQFTQVSSFNLWAYTPAPVPQCNGLVCHADELPYVFNTAERIASSISFNQAEEALAQAIGGTWTSFAKDRNPGSTWPLFKPNKTYRLLSESSSTANDPLNATANCSLWDSIGYASPQTLTRVFPGPRHP
jgi:carboxylesterase type B